MPHPLLTEYFEDLLTKDIQKHAKEKFSIFYPDFDNKKCDDEYHFRCFTMFGLFFEYLSNDIKENPYEENIQYVPEQKFNYYILIKESFYKEFKKINLDIECDSLCYNKQWDRDMNYDIFPDVTKFIEGSYSKKRVRHNDVNYISLKLRAFNNTFIPKICLTWKCINPSYKSNMCYSDILIMIKPVKKKYSKIITLRCFTIHGERKYRDTIELTPFLTLKYNNSYQNISPERIENILEKYKEKEYYEECFDDDDFNALVFNEETKQSFDVNLIEFYKK